MTRYMDDDDSDGFLDFAGDIIDAIIQMLDDIKWLIYGGSICRQSPTY